MALEGTLRTHLLCPSSGPALPQVSIEIETPSFLLCGIIGTFPGIAAPGEGTTDHGKCLNLHL